MSVIHTNNITNKDGTSGPTISGISTVSSTGFMQVPVGDTRTRIVLPNENIVTDGLVLYLDAGKAESFGGDGTTWRDLSGENNNGTLANGVGFTEDYGGSLIFDGVDENATVGSSVLTTGETSISMWVKPDSNQTSGLGDLNVGGGGLILYQVGTIIMMGFRGTPEMRTTTQFITSNVWNHITWVYNNGSKSSTSSFQIYLNSEIEPTLTIFGFGIGGGTVFNRIGSDQNGPYFDGNIAQVSIYNKALTASEVQQNFNATKSRF